MVALISVGFLVVAWGLWYFMLRGRPDVWEYQRAKPATDMGVEVVVNQETGEVSCPACFYVGPLKAGVCADCGLNLGEDPTDNS